MKTVSLKELRENVSSYAAKVQSGASFIVIKRSKPLFKIAPVEDERWEEVVDFTKISRGGVSIDEVLARL
ncbi:hypothetical protein A3H10_00115 [Candidatus Uhrbacteria bacterium RIFCSPLOWO2_12_FULL_46_10]|uniref:Uncharacterized protein n=1 Tax=Candidatus Uhrbacteria bacterium RIFCSPLOWO2_01_FULL_47_25 TaxID=1802402 RepID=A0A1F7URN8_9BACT|nr:MAG: hypothetical protein UX68_C0015G0003 [Parcubacteria group bacterium GW2011_GWA2_46_9]OGL59898.1 MAG: hypothetical protein A2752_04120 [Candidatus Uhrbacteria bacterium RIFCSPHIGHO2_01_FULL_46_23]OGL69449.1 MAG: hypothetical protein A3D60_03190 [Candidatus Uhrbacteria bacterium RIFCSPHIGHO2_02_FULL_47_29]OGL75361.1 MAG: hypothetical protein A3E96_02510 [Candidatus Uhrbacteria bacterium RIFCSPHIGHO2_12_FULL_46_13]OGL80905.1 MAG: hypothetical protein A2936_05755 [Candidatus Uhrbacteria bac